MNAQQHGQRVPAADLVPLDLKVSRDGGSVRYLEGARYGLATSLFSSSIPPGTGPGTHAHPYAEIFVLHEGSGRYAINDEIIEADAGDVVIVPEGAWHSFVSSGSVNLRQTAIHEAPQHTSTLAPESGEL